MLAGNSGRQIGQGPGPITQVRARPCSLSQLIVLCSVMPVPPHEGQVGVSIAGPQLFRQLAWRAARSRCRIASSTVSMHRRTSAMFSG